MIIIYHRLSSMQRIRRKWCSLKKSYLFLCGLSFMFMLLVYFNHCSVVIFANIYLKDFASKYSLMPDDLSACRHRSAPSVFQILSGSAQVKEGEITSLRNSTCSSQSVKVNWTSCVGCLRPYVREVVNIREIRQKYHLTHDKPPTFFTAATEIVETLVTDYRLVPDLDCPYLLALQPSVLDRRHERETVRDTWGSVAKNQTWPNRNINANVKVVFVVGNQWQTHNYSENCTAEDSICFSTRQFEDIKSEAVLHNDILYLNMIDSYQNLTLKLLSAFKWVKDNCQCVKFVLKVDYDTFVNVPLLVDTLLYFEDRLEFSILGMIYVSVNAVMRGGMWGVPKSLYPMKSYPEYGSGNLRLFGNGKYL